MNLPHCWRNSVACPTFYLKTSYQQAVCRPRTRWNRPQTGNCSAYLLARTRSETSASNRGRRSLCENGEMSQYQPSFRLHWRGLVLDQCRGILLVLKAIPLLCRTQGFFCEWFHSFLAEWKARKAYSSCPLPFFSANISTISWLTPTEEKPPSWWIFCIVIMRV